MTDDLLEQVRALAPWHMDIPLTSRLRTADGNAREDLERVPVTIDPTELRPLLERLYPAGLTGKSFLDCACNAGGYSFLASSLGATCVGFDVREHWIAQARFLQRQLGIVDEQVRFLVSDLYDVGEHLGEDRFDVCLFKGIFYHLPDPMAGLQLVADRTDGVVIVDTDAVAGHEDGFLKLVWEGVVRPKSGVHGLAWRPTGPRVLVGILDWLGFPATAVVFARRRRRHPELARIRIIGARDPGQLAAIRPSVSMLVPEDGAIVSGMQPLDAGTVGSIVEVVRVEFVRSGPDRQDVAIGAAAQTPAGWILPWETTTVPNGTHRVQAVAVDHSGNTARSDPISVVVRN